MSRFQKVTRGYFLGAIAAGITTALDATNGDTRKVQKLSLNKNLNTLMIYDDNRHQHRAEVTGILANLVELSSGKFTVSSKPKFLYNDSEVSGVVETLEQNRLRASHSIRSSELLANHPLIRLPCQLRSPRKAEVLDLHYKNWYNPQ